MKYKKYVPALKALSDETRMEIVDMLTGGELCACMILEKFSITQPTLSYHMKVLVSSSLVNARRDGAWMHYSLNENLSKELSSFFSALGTAAYKNAACSCAK